MFESRSGEVCSIQHYVIKFISDLRQIGGFHWVLRFPPSINHCHNISEILLKVALNTIILTLVITPCCSFFVLLQVVAEISTPDMAGSEIDLGLSPGGKIKVVISSSIKLESLVRYCKLQLTVSHYLFGIFKSFLGQAQISWYLV